MTANATLGLSTMTKADMWLRFSNLWSQLLAFILQFWRHTSVPTGPPTKAATGAPRQFGWSHSCDRTEAALNDRDRVWTVHSCSPEFGLFIAALQSLDCSKLVEPKMIPVSLVLLSLLAQSQARPQTVHEVVSCSLPY